MHRGKYRVHATQAVADIERLQRFRGTFFGADRIMDKDAFDETHTHILIEEAETDTLVGCFRLALFSGKNIASSYAAQFYGVSALAAFQGKMLELGRLCIDAERSDPDILRLVWIALAQYVDGYDVRLLFGCTSFPGVDPTRYAAGFAALKSCHLAPAAWTPLEKAPEVVHFATDLPAPCAADDTALPALLRSYIALGAWVSDHAVIDRNLGTLHVFTALETDKIPAGRLRLLRAS